nr:MAG TPA: hypothetical protein [Caudoviricetes sp.]
MIFLRERASEINTLLAIATVFSSFFFPFSLLLILCPH